MGEGGGGIVEDGVDIVFVVELVDDVYVVVVFWFFFGGELFLILNLEDDFDVFKGGGNGGYGDGGEEIGGGNLGNGEVVIWVDGRGGVDDVFVEVVVLEGDGDCLSSKLVFVFLRKKMKGNIYIWV